MRRIELKFTGKKIGEGRIPLNVLQKVLEGVQNAVYQIGEYHYSPIVARERGPFPKPVIDQCTLELISISKGSFVVNLELPKENQLALFPEMSDLGEQALNTFVAVLESLTVGNENLYKEIKDKKILQKVLRTVQDFLPRSDDYALIVSSPNKTMPPITYKVASVIERLLYKPLTCEKELFGKIVEVRIVESRYFGILTKEGRIIKCYFDEDWELEVIQLTGKEVRVTGEACNRQVS
ncbi:hypothetical protein BSNK01_09490 [Bacillaceae bacterium]